MVTQFFSNERVFLVPSPNKSRLDRLMTSSIDWVMDEFDTKDTTSSISH